MSATRILVAGSLALNVALAAWLWRNPGAMSDGKPSPLAAALAKHPGAAQTSEARDKAIASGDFAAMIAAGVDEATARDIAAGAAFAAYRSKLQAVRPPATPDPRFWRTPPINSNPLSADQRDALVQAERELADTLRKIYGEDVPLQGAPDLRLSFLPEWKQETLRRLEQDYRDIEQDFLRQISGMALPSDEKKLAALRAQRETEISSLLSPEERQQYNVRGAPSAMGYLVSSGAAFETEDDYKVFVSSMLARDSRNGDAALRAQGYNPNDDTVRTYQSIYDQLGAEKYAALQNYRDNDRIQLESLKARLDLPPDTTDKVLALRQSYSLESKQIAANTTASSAQRSQDVKALGARARGDLIAILGDEAGRAYTIRQQNWPELLSRGVAFTTDHTEMFGGKAALSATYPWSQPQPAPQATK